MGKAAEAATGKNDTDTSCKMCKSSETISKLQPAWFKARTRTFGNEMPRVAHETVGQRMRITTVWHRPFRFCNCLGNPGTSVRSVLAIKRLCFTFLHNIYTFETFTKVRSRCAQRRNGCGNNKK